MEYTMSTLENSVIPVHHDTKQQMLLASSTTFGRLNGTETLWSGTLSAALRWLWVLENNKRQLEKGWYLLPSSSWKIFCPMKGYPKLPQGGPLLGKDRKTGQTVRVGLEEVGPRGRVWSRCVTLVLCPSWDKSTFSLWCTKQPQHLYWCDNISPYCHTASFTTLANTQKTQRSGRWWRWRFKWQMRDVGYWRCTAPLSHLVDQCVSFSFTNNKACQLA